MTATAQDQEIVYDIEHVTLRFGGVVSLNDVSVRMYRGEILAIIGPNGAGKTSLFNTLTGVYTPQEGRITVAGRPGDRAVSVIGKKTHVINHLGVARTFQNIRLFPALTALENVKVGIETRQKAGPLAAMLGMPWQRHEERESTAAGYALLRDVGLAERANELASALAYGEQRRLEIARALGTNPGVLSARRTGRRHEPRGETGAGRADQPHQPGSEHQRAAHRARHEARYVDRAQDHRPELRREDRRRHATGDPA